MSPRERAAPDRLLLQFAPLIYVAWSDGALTGEELAQIEERLTRFDHKSDELVALLHRWLNPADPPTPSDLNGLLELMRRAAAGKKLKKKRKLSLEEIGRALGGNGKTDEVLTPELQALRSLEAVLGVDNAEALNAILAAPHERFALAEKPFDIEALRRYQLGDRLEIRERVQPILTAPECALDPSVPYQDFRARVLECTQWLTQHGLGMLAVPEQYGGAGRIAHSIYTFETIAFHDLSLLVKYGVHFGLFGGSVLQLGTARHHEKYLKAIGTLQLPGCFAMTETGHGSNVRDIETTATYDPFVREFIIHTPHERARKDYIGNAALHGQMATVFAQLEVAGERHGVHALLVPIRDAQGNLMRGVRIEDCGLKAGLNGVDNGRIYFDQVHVPRENLLNRFADVTEDGVYTSAIPSASRRFFTMLGTLVAGRISIACASCSVAKLALTIAARYVARREQFGPEGEDEVPVLAYQVVQRRLLPRIATAYALDAALHGLVLRYDGATEDDQRDIEVLAASLKAYASRFALDTVQECRELCGGAGYMFPNRFGTLRDDLDIFTTFEGANPVLEQLAAKGLLTDFREQFGEMRFWSIARFVTARASTAVAELNPIITRRTTPEHLRDPEFHDNAFRFREQHLLNGVARRLKARIDEGDDSFDAMNACQEHLVTLAQAHAERVLFEALQARTDACPDKKVKSVLAALLRVYALAAIDHDRGWYLESGYVEQVKSKAIRRELLDQCKQLAPSAVALVDAFGIPDALVRAPLAVRTAG